jgi:uncharacterized Tic20 family protein
MDDDARHLDLLATFHYVVAGIVFLFGCFPIIHLVIGLMVLTGTFDNSKPGGSPPDFFGLIFVVMALFMIACMWTLAGAVALAGARLKERRSYTYCLVIAALECMFAPFGTVLGVFTILVLSRPSVKALFGVAPPSAST